MDNLKIYQADDYYKIVAESEQQAKEFYINELEGIEEDFYGNEVDPDDNKMWCSKDDIEPELQVPPYKKWDNRLYVEVTLRTAMEHRTDKAPYLLSVSSDLL